MASSSFFMTRSRVRTRSRSRNVAARFLARILAGATLLMIRLAIWRERRARRADLGRLDDRMLADIGLSRADAELEVAKPFWRN